MSDFEYSKVKQHGDPTKGYVDGHTNLIFGNMYHWELSVSPHLAVFVANHFWFVCDAKNKTIGVPK